MQSTQVTTIEFTPIKENDEDYEKIEAAIRDLLRREIYFPIIKELGVDKSAIINSKDGLLEAIRTGRIQFYRGSFSGRFNASISKDLKAMGSQWERKTGTFKLPQSSLPLEVRNAISASLTNFQRKLDALDKKLSQILPEEIADKLKVSDLFDKTIWKVDKELNGSLSKKASALSIPPQLTDESREKIAEEWQNNLKLEIKDWTQKEIAKLRKDVQASVFAGNRRDAAVKIVKDSHDTSINKAKFLARQETRLLLSKFKQVRYEESGVRSYIWKTVNRPVQAKGGVYVKGMVRHDHAVLDGTTQRWNNPPITNRDTGARNNPGEDYNCRCYAIPVVSFKKGT
jgi:uncharacterized protein with gpF-like domain